MIYIGCYTEGPAKGEGIHVCRFDRMTGRMHLNATIAAVNPSYLAFDRRRGRLFAVSEIASASGGAISAYALEGATGNLKFVNRQPTGSLPCYVSVHPDGTLVAEANYLDGSVALYPIAHDGSLGSASDVARHTGSSVHPQRQKGPRTHAAVFDPSGQFLFAPDLGVDRVFVYQLERARGKLIPHNPLQVAPGSGPRHLVFHRSKPFAYVVNELSSTIVVCSYDAPSGQLTIEQTVSTLPAGHVGENYCADIHIHPSGSFLYASNRGHDSIVGFIIDQATGWLSRPHHTASGGSWPRSFALDRTGAWLLVANQHSNTVALFRIQTSGRLLQAGAPLEIAAPAFVRFFEE